MFDNTSRMGILFFLWCINQPILCLKDGFCFCVLWTSTTYRVWPCSLSFLLTGCSPDGAFSVLHTRRVPHWEQSEPSHYEKDSVWTAKKYLLRRLHGKQAELLIHLIMKYSTKLMVHLPVYIPRGKERPPVYCCWHPVPPDRYSYWSPSATFPGYCTRRSSNAILYNSTLACQLQRKKNK